MNIHNLNREQRDRPHEQVGRQLRYLGKLQRRMQLRGWGDDLYKAVVAAYDKVHALNCALHSACCDAERREQEARGEAWWQNMQPPSDDRPPFLSNYGPG